VRTKEVLQRDKEDRNILHTTKRRNAKWFGHFLHRICFLKRVTKGKIEGSIKWREHEEEDVNTYWMPKQRLMEIKKRKI